MLEIAIKIKTADRTQTHKHLLYEPVTMSHEDKILAALIKEAVDKFAEEPEEISVRALYFW